MNPFENKKEIQKKAEEVTPSVRPEEKLTNLVVHSETDAFIMDRIKAQPKTREEIDVQLFERPKEGHHALSLPEELTKHEKEYAFCWIYKKKKAIDEAMDIYHWTFVTRNYFSELADHYFSARGVFERGDEVLMFRSRKLDEEMRRQPGLESTMRVKARKEAHLNDPAFYIPDSDEFETDPDTGKRKKIPVVGV